MGKEFYFKPTKETHEQNLRNYKEIPLKDHKHFIPINRVVFKPSKKLS